MLRPTGHSKNDETGQFHDGVVLRAGDVDGQGVVGGHQSHDAVDGVADVLQAASLLSVPVHLQHGQRSSPSWHTELGLAGYANLTEKPKKTFLHETLKS